MQIEIVNLNDLTRKDYPYRKMLSIIDFAGLIKKFGKNIGKKHQ